MPDEWNDIVGWEPNQDVKGLGSGAAHKFLAAASKTGAISIAKYEEGMHGEGGPLLLAAGEQMGHSSLKRQEPWVKLKLM